MSESRTGVGSVIADRYRVLRVLGEGTLGPVFLAEDAALGIRVAVRVIPRGSLVGTAVDRFKRLATQATRIAHPNVALVRGFGELADGSFYVVTEFVDGQPLSSLMKERGALPLTRASEILRQVAAALDAAQLAGIVNRNVTPSGVMIVAGAHGADLVKVVDLWSVITPDGSNSVVRAGSVIGTPDYLSPEQVRGEPPDGRSSVYSLGVIAFEMLTGTVPYAGSPMERLAARVTVDAVRIGDVRPDVIGVQEAVGRALKRNAEERYQSAGEFAAAFERAGQQKVPLPPRLPAQEPPMPPPAAAPPAPIFSPPPPPVSPAPGGPVGAPDFPPQRTVVATPRGTGQGAGYGDRSPNSHWSVRVYYGTDRVRQEAGDLETFFGREQGNLSLGFCDVTVPSARNIGELPRPTILKLEFRENVDKHVVIGNISVSSRDEFCAEVRNRLARSNSSDCFVFIHGYNVTFAEAARRTAQLAVDLKFAGAPMFYSWPSQGRLRGYLRDSTYVERAVPRLREFLTLVAQECGARTIHLVAHSMGNRALTNALREFVQPAAGIQSLPTFREVILAAPDIDAAVFREQILPAIRPKAARITLYVSPRDRPLQISRWLWGGTRMGHWGRQPIEGVDVIDASTVDSSLMGHGYIGDNRSVIDDVYYLLDGKPADKRFTISRRPGETFWRFRA